MSSESSYHGSSPDESIINREKEKQPSPVYNKIDPLGLEAVIIEEGIKTEETWQTMQV